LVYRPPVQVKLVKTKTEVTAEVLVQLQLGLVGAMYGSTYAAAVKRSAELGQDVSQEAQSAAAGAVAGGFNAAQARVFVRRVCLYFLTLTGCRPVEAAYVVANHAQAIQAIEKLGGGVEMPHHRRSLAKAVMPKEYTKTHLDYTFYVPKTAYGQAFAVMVQALKDFHPQETGWPGGGSTRTLYLAVESSLWYHMRLQHEQACSELRHRIARPATEKRCAACAQYTARSLRCYYATRYVQHCAESAILGHNPGPNPLQHTSIAITRERYAAAGADSYEGAVRRLAKSGDGPTRARMLRRCYAIEVGRRSGPGTG
jgi:hypothetical protein